MLVQRCPKRPQFFRHRFHGFADDFEFASSMCYKIALPFLQLWVFNPQTSSKELSFCLVFRIYHHKNDSAQYEQQKGYIQSNNCPTYKLTHLCIPQGSLVQRNAERKHWVPAFAGMSGKS